MSRTCLFGLLLLPMPLLLLEGCFRENPEFDPTLGRPDGPVIILDGATADLAGDGPSSPDHFIKLDQVIKFDQPQKLDKGPNLDVGPKLDKGPNLDFGPKLDQGPNWDVGPKLDQGPTTDLQPWPDQTPPADMVPWKCTGDADCDDSKACTKDTCNAGQCVNTLLADACLVSGVCYKKDDLAPGNDCQICAPTTSTSAFTNKPDNAACALDGLGCTQDLCMKGQCTHPVTTGCVINKTCVATGAADPQDVCKACIPTVSTTAYTAADGKPCTPSSNQVGMCVASKCMGFVSQYYEPQGATSTSLRAVNYIENAKAVWAVGRYRTSPTSSEKGLLVSTSPSSSGALSQVLMAAPMSDLRYNVAVGHGGQILRHTGTQWVDEATLKTAVSGQDRFAVWGASVGGVETYYLAGTQSTGLSAMLRCAAGPAGGFVCGSHSGFVSGESMGRLVGTLTSTGGQGPLWTVLMGNNTLEDIYYNNGAQVSWSTAGPQGCKDQGNNPCAGTSSNTYDLGGSSTSDVWLVGTNGMILSYNGTAWSKVQNAISNQSDYHFTAVYSNWNDKLTTFAAYTDSYGSSGHRVYLFNYNHSLKTLFGPILLSQASYNSENYLLDIGGPGYSNLWMVGQHEVQSGGSTRVRGWILQLK